MRGRELKSMKERSSRYTKNILSSIPFNYRLASLPLSLRTCSFSFKVRSLLKYVSICLELYVSNEYILQMFLKCNIYFLFTLRWKVEYIYPLYNGSNALSAGSKVNIFINVSSNMTPELASFDSWEHWWTYISMNASVFTLVILYKNTMT